MSTSDRVVDSPAEPGGLTPLTHTRMKAVVALTLASIAAYLLVLRPRQLRWGATDEEVARPLPGDDLVNRPTFNATRAVTIEARPEDIWPWLVQMGFHRAGWYSYDRIDNGGTPSSERIIPELQDVRVGDFLPMTSDGKVGVWVRAFEPNRWLLWWDQKKGDMTWLWQLDPIDAHHTRLISRVRGRYHWTSPGILFSLLVDVGDIIMMRKCMLGIKRRAEGQTRQRIAAHASVRGDPSTAEGARSFSPDVASCRGNPLVVG